MSAGFSLTPAARADLDQIWSYSIENWGVDQAANYIRVIQTTLESLAEGTGISRDANVRSGYQKARTGSHYIYFRRTDAGLIVVVRILHQSMDVERHI